MERLVSPCFALFIQSNEIIKPIVFMCDSEKKLNDWLNQISIYLSKLSKILSG